MSERMFTKPVVSMTVAMRLTEAELAALNAIAGYGVEPFLSVFYEKMGRAYLEPHEAGLRTLFACIQNETNGLLRQAADARDAFNKGAPHDRA